MSSVAYDFDRRVTENKRKKITEIKLATFPQRDDFEILYDEKNVVEEKKNEKKTLSSFLESVAGFLRALFRARVE